MDSIRSRGFLTCHLSDSMFPILKWDRDFAMSLQVFPPFLTSLNYSVFLLWPAGVTQISFQRLVPSLASSDSIIEFLSPLSLLYSLDWLVLNSLFWWYCSQFTLYCLILIQAFDIFTLSCCITYRFHLTSSWYFWFMYSFSNMLNLWFPLFTSFSLLTSFLLFVILFSSLYFHHGSLWLLLFLLFSDFCFTPSHSAITMLAAFTR